MKTLALGVIAATLLASAASAAPLQAAKIASPELGAINQVRLVCNEYGHCFRTGPRYVRRYYDDDDGYVVRRSYGYYGGGPGYYGRGYDYYGGPSVGFSFGTRSW